jgi:hypothetical protein
MDITNEALSRLSERVEPSKEFAYFCYIMPGKMRNVIRKKKFNWSGFYKILFMPPGYGDVCNAFEEEFTKLCWEVMRETKATDYDQIEKDVYNILHR